jgi:hypothetical protein
MEVDGGRKQKGERIQRKGEEPGGSGHGEILQRRAGLDVVDSRRGPVFSFVIRETYIRAGENIFHVTQTKGMV